MNQSGLLSFLTTQLSVYLRTTSVLLKIFIHYWHQSIINSINSLVIVGSYLEVSAKLLLKVQKVLKLL